MALITGAPIRNLDGEVVGSVGIHFDISERKMLELETNRALASEAYARNRERGLLMKMSHEIRTPINAINGMLHLMNNMTRSPEQEAIWQGAIRATNMLRKVVDDVLDLSKIEVGKPALNLSQINVVEVTSGVAKMHHLLAEEKGIELDCGCQLSNKQRTLDVDKWLQILTNLLGNAIKYTESGTVVLSIHDHPDKDDWIAAEVTDEGPGIPKGQEERIFQPFGLLDYDSILLEQPHAEGSTGLGLSIARELAQLMGGALRLMPSQKGAKFLLEVPAPAWASGTESNPGVTQSDDDLTVPQWDGRGLRVLIAEDNDINVLYAKALLDRWNVELHGQGWGGGLGTLVGGALRCHLVGRADAGHGWVGGVASNQNRRARARWRHSIVGVHGHCVCGRRNPQTSPSIWGFRIFAEAIFALRVEAGVVSKGRQLA